MLRKKLTMTIQTVTQSDKVDPWDKLPNEVNSVLNAAWEEQVEENLSQGLPKHVAQVQASNSLLPIYRKKLRNLYGQYLRWYHDLKNDPVHKKVMKTLRSFMEEDEMEYAEAVEAATSKRKYLLNTLFDQEDFPKDASNDEEDFTYEARKRKHYETL